MIRITYRQWGRGGSSWIEVRAGVDCTQKGKMVVLGSKDEGVE